ncbi:unnamed protein product [Cylicocyclus nassatus]|uniref:non-specific protein-tyrosine kinase n=1 Tax=Cylicocyclus nassatus TaxID=53992 RepID=A0AA36MHZ7_CYLNA|nr:unnamed protein product [Cylicocyclus nassatus]
MSNPGTGASIQKDLLDVWRIANVEDFQQKLVFSLNIRRLEHISHVQDKEFQSIGLTPTQIQDLRRVAANVQEVANRRNTSGEVVYIPNNNLADNSSSELNKAIIAKEQIKIMETIGEGTFSVVKRAIWYHPGGSKIDVAVKILRDVSPSLVEDLEVEASHLLKLQHANLIRLFGIVRPAMMVFELCEGGELLTRLRDTSKPAPLVTLLLEYCLQIAKALTFLESKHVVHRDVAARNVLLSKDEKVVKLCDFGLMRNLKENERSYTMQGQKRVPFSWCPPESLRHRKFSHASDVWAFGVTAWEIFSYGEDPWIGCRAIDVLQRLDAGERLEKPKYCSQQIYDLISLCWNINPDLRPKFSLLRTHLLGVEFNIAEVRDASNPDPSGEMLEMMARDRVIVIESSGFLWYGQNERTHLFGKFTRSSVFVNSKTVSSHPHRDTSAIGGNSRISLPIRGSFIHAGHGDVLGNSSWGTPDKIDDVYLKNPIIGDPLNLTMMPLSVPSVTNVSSTSETVFAGMPSTSKAQAKPDYEDPFDIAAFDENFTPTRIKLPEVFTTGRISPSTNISIERPRPSSSRSAIPSTSSPLPSHNGWEQSAPVDRALFSISPNLQAPITPKPTNGTSMITTQPKESGVVKLPMPKQPVTQQPVSDASATRDDPFEISSILSNTVLRERYNNILEKKAALIASQANTTMPLLPSSFSGPSNVRRSETASVPLPSSSASVSIENSVVRTRPHSNILQPTVLTTLNNNRLTRPQSAVMEGWDRKEHNASPSFSRETGDLPIQALNDVSMTAKTEPGGRIAPSSPVLDEIRKRRLESAITSVLPQPSQLFFGNGSGTNGQVQMRSSTPPTSQNVARVPAVNPVRPLQPVLNLNGVLEPIRLPTSVSARTTVSSSQPSLRNNQQIPSMSNPNSLPGNSMAARPLSQTQLPLFSLSNNTAFPNYQRGVNPYQYNFASGVPAVQFNQMRSSNGVLPPRLEPFTPFRVAEGEDVLEVLDPLSATSRERRTTPTPAASSLPGSITLAERMEILYSDAPFADRSRCDQMVAKCRGDIESALRELKVEHLVDTQIAANRERAREALNSKSWDLNAAAELLLMS